MYIAIMRTICSDSYLKFLTVLFNRRWSGLYAWHVPANFLVLRLISFNLDYHWALIAKTEDKIRDGEISSQVTPSRLDSSKRNVNIIVDRKHDDDSVTKTSSSPSSVAPVSASRLAKDISETHRPLHEYNILNCISYCIYAPLYVAGPIITFNAYMEYSRHPQKTESK